MNPARAVRWIAHEVLSIIPQRAERERAITAAHAEHRQTIDQSYEQRRAEADQRRDNAIRDADANLQSITQRVESECEAARSKADRIADELRVQTDEKARRNEKAARKAHQESIWMAETMFEANEARPREQFEQTRKAVDSQMEVLDEVEDAATTRMRRYRQSPSTSGDASATHIATDEDTDDVDALSQQLSEAVTGASDSLRRLHRLFLPKLFVDIWPFLFVIMAAFIGGGAAVALLDPPFAQQLIIGIGGGSAAAIIVLVLAFLIARKQCRRIFDQIRDHSTAGRTLRDRVMQAAEHRRDAQRQELRRQRDEEIQQANAKIEPVLSEIRRRHERYLTRIQDKHDKQERRIREHREQTMQAATAAHTSATAAAHDEHARVVDELERWRREAVEAGEQQFAQQFDALQQWWQQHATALYDQLQQVQQAATQSAMPWTADAWRQWTAPTRQEGSIAIGRFAVDIATLPGGVPTDSTLELPGPAQFDLPALLHVPGDGSLLIETEHAEQRQRAMRLVQLTMARLLTVLPPGKVRFVIIDPVALGQSFAGFMHLGDYEGALIGQRIWTEQAHIQQRLVDLTEHMENVIQKYLRNEFDSIAQYNDAAGEIAEPYRFLVIADFPTNFTDESARRLTSIATSGARCGVHTIVHLDRRADLPRGFDVDELRQNASTLVIDGDACTWDDPDLGSLSFEPDEPPGEELLTTMMHDLGRLAVEATRVEVPFEAVIPATGEEWTRSAAQQVRVPLGRSGASKIQELTLGRGTSQHALIAGKTGSGKSTLLHVLITSLALWYRPDEIELYLVDFKKGVEFKTYATHELPHARVVAIESDREFGLSVLQKLDAEMRRRGDLFRDRGVQDVAGYRQLDDAGPMPRVLLIIDEFQEFFTEDDRIAQDAALLLDRLVRQGRAFGMHVLLGSQTLGGAYSLARSTIGQMNVRIALQCSESDSYLIMNEDNAAARLLSRPGEAIYNDAAGLIEGNSPFQIVWLPDDTRETMLSRVRELSTQRGEQSTEPTVVFEGNTPGRLETNNDVRRLLARSDWPTRPAAPRVWLGDPVAIKDATAATFARHGGANLLIVGQRHETADCLITAALLSLAVQHAPDDLTLLLLDGAADDALRAVSPVDVADALPHDSRMVSPRDVAEAMNDLVSTVRQRHDGGEPGPPVFVLINGLHRFRALRHVDDFSFSSDDKPPSPDKLFAEIVRDGPEVGVHVIAWCDSVNNLNRMIERAVQREFEMRALMQMSAADSTALIDSPEAGRIGLQRMIFASEDAGVLEKFRPYGPPDRGWLEQSIKTLASRT